jgi:hypothetical protein
VGASGNLGIVPGGTGKPACVTDSQTKGMNKRCAKPLVRVCKIAYRHETRRKDRAIAADNVASAKCLPGQNRRFPNVDVNTGSSCKLHHALRRVKSRFRGRRHKSWVLGGRPS